MNRLLRLKLRPQVLDGVFYREHCWLRNQNHPATRGLELRWQQNEYQQNHYRKLFRYNRGRVHLQCQHTLPPSSQQQKGKPILIKPKVTLRQLAFEMGIDPVSVANIAVDLGEELENGFNTVLTPDLAELLVLELNMEPLYMDPMETTQKTSTSTSASHRPPVVTVMGHVDHGKTTLLDSLRKTSVAAREAGGITQHIGAFSVHVQGEDKTITFIDTPGHAAFETMRARGANSTDIVVLVVAADDGVKTQTVESIKHASNAGVPIIVAINKVDKQRLNVDKTKQQLLQHGIQLEEFGGDVQVVEISALKGTNLDGLLEAISTQAELQDLKSNQDCHVQGVVLEARKDKAKGKIATVLVKRGTLEKGCVIQTNLAFAKVRLMLDDKGNVVSKATPSTPVEVMGWRDLPTPGDEVFEVESQREALEAVTRQKARLHNQEIEDIKAIATDQSLPNRQPSKIYDSSDKLNVVLKGDVNGSLEAINDALKTYRSKKVKLNLLSVGVGAISESDLRLAETFKGVVFGFNVTFSKQMKSLAKRLGVSVYQHKVIYKLLEDLKNELSNKLPPIEEENLIGEAVILQVFRLTGSRKAVVGGCRVKKGNLVHNSQYRITRGNKIIFEGKLSSMKRGLDNITEAKRETECGLSFDKFTDVLEGDIVQSYKLTVHNQTIDWEFGF